LLDFTQARIGGGFILQYAPLDLHDLAGLVVEEMRAAHPGREIVFEPAGDGGGEWDSAADTTSATMGFGTRPRPR
jgi:hypothetical protein